MRVRRALVFGLATAAVLAGARSLPVSAHAYILSTTPANGERVDVLPAAITVTFSESVTLYSQADAVSVVDADGVDVSDGTGRLDADRTALTIGLKRGLPHGVYIASWSVISADTHPVGGSIQFGYGVRASLLSSEGERSPSETLTLVAGVTKGVVYAALVVGIGVLPAALLLGASGAERRRVVAVASVALAVAAAGSLAQVVVQYLWTTSALPPGTAGEPGAFAASSYATAVWVRIAALAVAALVVPTAPSRVRGAGFAVAAAVAIGATVRNGHGGSGERWQFLSTVLHAAAAIAWLGGLVALGWLLLQRRLDGSRVALLPRWSVYAASSVAVLAASGVPQAIVGVGFVPALFSTTYGALLLAKLAVVAGALALAVWGNRWVRTQPRADASDDGASDDGAPPGRTARLRGRVRAEAALVAVVVLLSGVLSSVTPGEAAYAPQATIGTEIGPYDVTVAVAPARIGPQSFRVVVTPPSADAPLPQSLDLVLSQAEGPIGEVAVEFPYRIPGTFRAGEPTPLSFVSSAVTVPASGRWTATLTVVAGPLDQYTAAFDYRVR